MNKIMNFKSRKLLFSFRHYSKVKIVNDKYGKLEYDSEQFPEKVTKNYLEILKHYSGSQLFQENFKLINYKFLQRKSTSPYTLIVADEKVAKKIVDCIKNDVMQSSGPVFEANPGIGLITRELLKLNLSKICIFERDAQFRKGLIELNKAHHCKLKIHSSNILELWKITFLDQMDKGGRLKDIMEDVVTKQWEDEPCVKIVGTLPTNYFLVSILLSIAFQHGISLYGRPELYILIPPNHYARLTLPKRGVDFLFNIFFNWKTLMEVDNKAVLPWTSDKPKSIKRLKKLGINPEKYYLVKAVPKRDLYSIVSPNLLKPLWYFSKTVIHTHKIRVIPSLEKWIPGCGPRLIAQGIGVFTEFNDLTVDEIIKVFLDFVNWPEFANCAFLASMEEYLMKSEVDSEESLQVDSVSAEGTDLLEERVVLGSDHDSQSNVSD